MIYEQKIQKQIQQIQTQLNELQEVMDELSCDLDYKIITHHRKNPRDLLASLCDKYGSDKGELAPGKHPYPWPSHTYSDFCSRLFAHCRQHIKTVFECGLGTNNPTVPSNMGATGRPGASLRVWRDYFPNALIYGADIDRGILFEEDRIKTFYMDQQNPQDIKAVWSQTGVGSFDIMIDDGLHTFEAGQILFAHAIERLAPNGIYIIEDVTIPNLIRYKAFFADKPYVVDYVTLFRPETGINDNNLVVIRKPDL